MDYTLKELSQKMGIADLSEKSEVLYTYSQEKDKKFGGFAEVRLEDNGRLFSATLYHCRENYKCDDGFVHAEHEETIQVHAARIGNSEHFRIVHMEVDGQEQHPTNMPMIELGLCVFHSRIIDIEEGMTEQTLNKVKKEVPEVCGLFKENMDFAPRESTVVQFPVNRAKKSQSLTV